MGHIRLVKTLGCKEIPVTGKQSIQPPEAAEGEGKRPQSPPRGLVKRALDKGPAQASSPALQMRMAVCDSRGLGGKWEEEQGPQTHDRGAEQKGKRK